MPIQNLETCYSYLFLFLSAIFLLATFAGLFLNLEIYWILKSCFLALLFYFLAMFCAFIKRANMSKNQIKIILKTPKK